MDEIPSPYYFVPLDNRVYEPEWARQVSHDVPFSDGLSGELDIEVEAMRPIYVRNQAEKPQNLAQFHSCAERPASQSAQAQFEEWVSFCKLDGRYAIPGTSIKGVLRNVVKIAGFGSFRDAVPGRERDDERFSVRDLYLKPYQQRFVEGGEWNQATGSTTPIQFLSHGGWLRKEGEIRTVYPSDYQRVEQQNLATLAGTLRWDDFLNTAGDDKSNDPGRSAVRAKYDLWLGRFPSMEIRYAKGAKIDQSRNGRHTTTGQRGGPLPLNYGLAGSLGIGSDLGYLVFTGQPSNRRPPKNKHMEFIFEPPSICSARSGAIELTPEQVRDFERVHEDSRVWKHWKPKFDAGDFVPVFWIEPKRGEPRGNGLQALGLAQMFRYPADRTLRDGIPSSHFTAGHDLADLIFGSLHHDALRGRAAFSHFVAVGEPASLDSVWTVLGSPKPTFYPNYLEQEYDPGTGRLKNGKDYRTLMSDKVQLRGWKRYAVRRDWRSGDQVISDRDHDFTQRQPPSFEAATAFAPLKQGTKFKGKLRFHNLRPFELGALVWAIEWGGKGNLRHLIGMGKGMGLGSARMTILNRDSCSFAPAGGTGQTSVSDANTAFTTAMKKFAADWEDSESMRELMLLADRESPQTSTPLAYPVLLVNPSRNDFAKAKQKDNRLVLRSYGEVIGKHRRIEWNPSQAPSPTPVQPTGPKCEIVIVEKRHKLRAKEQGGEPTPIGNLDKFPEAVKESRWLAVKTDAGFMLLRRTSPDEA